MTTEQHVRSFTIAHLRDARLRLRDPLVVETWREGDQWCAGNEAFGAYGFGNHEMDAVEDFQRDVADLYWSLKDWYPRLGPGLLHEFKMLQSLIEERP